MLNVVIVGDREFGKATFLGLLYATQVKFGSDAIDDFRFHATAESIESVGVVFHQLMSGTFPNPAAKGGIRGISFQLGSSRSGRGILSHLGLRGGAPASAPTVRLAMLESRVEGVPDGSPSTPGGWKNIYDLDAIAIFVDGTKLAVGEEPPQESKLLKYDHAVASLLSAIQHPGELRDRRRIYPILVFSKFDRVRPEGLRGGGVAARPPPVDQTRARAAYAVALLKENMPRTLDRFEVREKGALTFADPLSLFTWVGIDAPLGRPERIRIRRREDGGLEPEYSSDEYLALLRFLGEIAVLQEKKQKLSRG